MARGAPKGNKFAVGSGGPVKNRPLTSILIQQLNEIDKNTSREKIHALVDEMITHAIGAWVEEWVQKRDEKTGKLLFKGTGKNKEPVLHLKKYKVRGDTALIKEIFDRVEGKPLQQHGIGDGKGRVTLIFSSEDEKL